MKQFFIATFITISVAIAVPAYADGGVMTLTSAPQAEVPVTINVTQAEALVPLLSQLATVYSRLLATTIGIPEAEFDDEGLLTVYVNETMVFPCKPEEGLTGEHCVRHVSGAMGESYVDLSAVPGFQYNDKFSYVLTLMRTRSDDDATTPYTFHLVHFTELTYEG